MLFERVEQSLWPCKDVTKYFDFDRDSKQVIGAGTYGQQNKVYKMRAKNDQKYYALKAIKMIHEKEGFPITALREIKLLRTLEHPNIISIIDINTRTKIKKGIKKQKTYCIMDLMVNDLGSIIKDTYKKKKQLDNEIIKYILYSILKGLQYLKQKNVIHRDIKSSNILLDSEGHVKLADFGLAKVIPKQGPKHLTPTVVTLSYRAPEVLFFKGQYGYEIDIWSVGCLAAEMSFCYPLFTSRSDNEHIKQIFELCGNPNRETWPEVLESEIYQGIQMKQQYPRRLISHIRNKKMNIDDELLDLIDRMLTMNPQTRIGIDQALEHNYFQSLDIAREQTKVKELTDNYKKYDQKLEEKPNKSFQTLGLDLSPVKKIKL